MAEERYTREQYIAKFGTDPDEDIAKQDAPADDTPGMIPRFARNFATGIATVPTAAYALPQTVAAGVGALFGDKPFMEGFKERIYQEGASDAIKQHLDNVMDEYLQEAPDIKPDNLARLMDEYQKSREFERFQRSQLTHGPRVAAEWQAGVRETLGDTRTEAQRDWVDAAQEIIGGSVVGLPAGWVGAAGKAASKLGAAGAVINNPVSRGIIKTGEVLTPATIPYSGTNVAINAGAGIAIDQGIRALKGESTAFSTGSDKTDAGIAEFGAITAAAGGVAALIGATKGRLIKSMQTNQLNNAIQASPTVSAPDEALPGTATFVAGEPRQEGAKAYMEQPRTMGAWHRGVNQFDEGAVGKELVRVVRGEDEAREWDAVFSGNTGAAQYDAANALARQSTHRIYLAREGMDPVRQQELDKGAHITSYVHTMDVREQALRQDLAAAQTALSNAKAAHTVQAATTRVNDLQAKLTRVLADDPHMRQMYPDLTMQDARSISNAYLNDMSPEAVKYRKAFADTAAEARDLLVKHGRITQAYANELANKFPNFIPAVQDPLHGVRGVQRNVDSIKAAVKSQLFASHTPREMLPGFEGPRIGIHTDYTDYAKGLDDRVTAPLDPYTAMVHYMNETYRAVANIVMRNDTIHKTAKTANGQWSKLVNDGYMQRLEVGGKHLFDANTIDAHAGLRDILNQDKNWIPRFDSGFVEFWRYGDPEMTAMLKQAPMMLTSGMKMIGVASRMFRANTTGVFAPLFAIKNAMYDYFAGMATRRSDRAFGPIQTGLRIAMRQAGAPEKLTNYITGILPDPSGFFLLPIYAGWQMIGVSRHYAYRAMAADLAKQGPIGAMVKAIGYSGWEQRVEKMLQVTGDSWAMQLLNKGVGHNYGLNDPAKVLGAVEASTRHIPDGLKTTWSFFRDIVGSVHMAPKRQFFAENKLDLSHKYGGKIPDIELEKLYNDTRNLAGNVGRRPGAQMLRNADIGFPYSAPIRASALMMTRAFSNADMAMYTMPRMLMMMTGVAYSQYMMTNWDEDAKRAWRNFPTWLRNRIIVIPTAETAAAWYRGETVPFSQDKVYIIDIAPDLAPAVAGTTAMMQMLGMLPSIDSVNTPWENAFSIGMDSLIPAMPPAVQAALGLVGMKLDPQGADTRGGSWMRVPNAFRPGPAGENVSSLGEQSTSTALVMNALLGANGGFLAKSLETFLHASKFGPEVNEKNMPIPLQSPDYARGMRLATTQLFDRMTESKTDVPPLWQRSEKYQIGTPTWQYVTQSKQHIRSIGGMNVGPAAERARKVIAESGGIPPSALTDLALISIAKEIASFDRSGGLGKLKKQYTDLSNMKRGLEVNYNMPSEQRREKLNNVIMQIQKNLEQQQLAIQYTEQEIGIKYGQALAPRLNGRQVDMKTLDSMMRESIGAGAMSAPAPVE